MNERPLKRSTMKVVGSGFVVLLFAGLVIPLGAQSPPPVQTIPRSKAP